MEIRKVNKFKITDIAPIEFVILGAGGNGGHLIHQLTRLVAKRNQRSSYKCGITVIDADIVEDKNISRQNFFPHDVGKKKAEVLARRYSAAHGIEVKSIDAFIETQEDLRNVYRNVAYSENNRRKRNKLVVLITCVDNHATRKVIDEFFHIGKDVYPMIWVDAGNEEFVGQVCLSCNFVPEKSRIYNANEQNFLMRRHVSEPYEINYLPTLLDHYPSIHETDDLFQSEMSCDDIGEEKEDQNIATNVLAADFMFMLINQMLTKGTYIHFLSFDASTAQFSTKKNFEADLKDYREEMFNMSPSKNSYEKVVEQRLAD